jgi:hypothetical protein
MKKYNRETARTKTKMMVKYVHNQTQAEVYI